MGQQRIKWGIIGWYTIYHAAEVSEYIWPNLIQCWIVPGNSQKNSLLSVLQHFWKTKNTQLKIKTWILGVSYWKVNKQRKIHTSEKYHFTENPLFSLKIQNKVTWCRAVDEFLLQEISPSRLTTHKATKNKKS